MPICERWFKDAHTDHQSTQHTCLHNNFVSNYFGPPNFHHLSILIYSHRMLFFFFSFFGMNKWAWEVNLHSIWLLSTTNENGWEIERENLCGLSIEPLRRTVNRNKSVKRENSHCVNKRQFISIFCVKFFVTKSQNTFYKKKTKHWYERQISNLHLRDRWCFVIVATV